MIIIRKQNKCMEFASSIIIRFRFTAYKIELKKLFHGPKLWQRCTEWATYSQVPPGADTRRKLKMCINYEDYMKKRNVLHLILLHAITYGLDTALA